MSYLLTPKCNRRNVKGKALSLLHDQNKEVMNNSTKI